jgi:hypothetical protein
MAHVLAFLFAMICFVYSGVEGFFIARRPVGFSALFMSDPIDPLDNLKGSARTPPPVVQPDQRAAGQLRNTSAPRVNGFGPDPGTASAVTAKLSRRDRMDVEQDVTEFEAKLLRVLPVNLYQGFIELCRKVTVKLAFVSLTGHVIMLLPVINYVRRALQMSGIPFLYIGPFVFIIPFALLWLWENNIIEMSLWRAELGHYLVEQQASAADILESEEERMLDILREGRETDESTLKRLASCRLFVKIDLNAIQEEVLAIKGLRGISKISSLATSTTESEADLSELESRNPQGNRIVTAVQALLTDSDAKGETNAELLRKLKKLQSELDEEDTE